MWRWIGRLRDNYRVLRQAVDHEGARYEQMSYDELLRLSDQPQPAAVGRSASPTFTFEIVDIAPGGDMHVCIDADGLPTLWGICPSYVFHKRLDGSVYYA